MMLIQILIYTFLLRPASPKGNSPPSSRHSTCPGLHYPKPILGTVPPLPQTLRALSHRKLHLTMRLPHLLCQLFRFPLTIPLPHRPFGILLHAFRLTNHGGFPAQVTPFISLLRMSHLAWLCTSRLAHLGSYLHHQP